MRKTLATLLLYISTLACMSKPTAAPTFAPTPLTIRTNPAIMVVNMPMRIVCQLPTDLKGEGNFHFGVVGMFMEHGPIDKLQYDRVIVGQCAPIRIICGFTMSDAKEATLIYRDMEPNGDCGR